MSKGEAQSILLPLVKSKPLVTLVTSLDSKYIPCFSAALESIIDCSSDENYYEIVVLSDGISDIDRYMISFSVRKKKNFEIRYIDMSETYGDNPEAAHGEFPRAAFFRLRLAELLPLHSHVVYLDPDIIVLKDPAAIFALDIADVYGAGVFDYTMPMNIARKLALPDKFGGVSLQEYLDSYLNLSPRAKSSYINSGVMVLNLEKIRQDRMVKKLIDVYYSKKFWLVDQDIINKVFDGKVALLDPCWNVFPRSMKEMSIIKNCDFKEWLHAYNNPAIIHFAGADLKPWKSNNIAYGDLFWFYLRKTPFYESFIDLYRSNAVRAAEDQNKKHFWRNFKIRLGSVLRPIA